MTDDVGHGLYRDAIGRHLYGCRQLGERLRRLHDELGSVHAKSLGLLFDSTDEAELVERWWSQPVD